MGEYYYTGQSIIGKKMFGNHGLDGRGPDLQTTGGLMYYQYDGLQNVSSLTNRLGEVIEDYRYDVFGNLYTGITAPYNTYGFTGMEYDPKAGLVNMHARWYAPDTGRFITPDSYSGDLMQPYTQNLYAYVGNNPVNRWDPMGYAESDMPSSFYTNNRSGNIEEQYVYEKVRYLTESSHDSSTVKGTDGWYTSWMNAFYEYWVYNYAYFKLEYTGGSTPDSGETYKIIDSRMAQTTLTKPPVISYGTNFTPFTSKEWYEEHKDDLISWGPIPPTIPSWCSSTVYSNTIQYNGINSSSGTTILFAKTSTQPNDALKSEVMIIQNLLNKALNDVNLNADGWYGSLTEKAVKEFQSKYLLDISGKVDIATMAKLLYVSNNQQEKLSQNLKESIVEDAQSFWDFAKKINSQVWGDNNQNSNDLFQGVAENPSDLIYSPDSYDLLDLSKDLALSWYRDKWSENPEVARAVEYFTTEVDPNMKMLTGLLGFTLTGKTLTEEERQKLFWGGFGEQASMVGFGFLEDFFDFLNVGKVNPKAEGTSINKVDSIIKQEATGEIGTLYSNGKVVKNLDNLRLTPAEKNTWYDLRNMGNNIDIIPTAEAQGPGIKAADSFLNGVKTELRNVTGNANTAIGKIYDGFKKPGTELVLIDARNNANIATIQQAQKVIGSCVKMDKIPAGGKVIIWTNEGFVRYP